MRPMATISPQIIKAYEPETGAFPETHFPECGFAPDLLLAPLGTLPSLRLQESRYPSIVFCAPHPEQHAHARGGGHPTNAEAHWDRSMTSAEQPVHLKVDRREKGRIIEQLQALPLVTLEMTDLDCGDYVGAQGLAIERKSSTDFILSIVDGSLYERAARLRSRYPHPAYIVEGDLFTRRFHQKAFDVHAALAYLTVHYSMPVVASPDSEQTAMIIYLMAAEAEHRLGRPLDVRVEHPVETTEAQLYFLQGLPGIDAERAERLLQGLHSVQSVLAASDEELRNAAGLDDQMIADIRALLTSTWPG